MGQSFSATDPAVKMAVKKFVDEAIQNESVLVFSKTYCPYCTKAKRALQKFLAAAKIKVVELDERQDGAEIQAYLGELTGGRSVPRVFIGGQVSLESFHCNLWLYLLCFPHASPPSPPDCAVHWRGRRY
jgi:glutaredoxin 3